MAVSQERELLRRANAWRRARDGERERMAQLTAAIVAAAYTMTEAQIVRVTGVNRQTVRKALGKGSRSSLDEAQAS